MKINEIITEAVRQRLDPKCWKGKHKAGTKIKGGVRVNNCVPNEGVAEGLDEAVGDNYLYHATQPSGMMRILRSGAIKASYRPQEATKARIQSPTVSTTRSKQYAESDDFVNFLNLTNEGNSVIIVFDRNAVANHYKMFSTSQGTQTVGDEFEEVIVVPKGMMPIQGKMKGFYFNPKRTLEIEEFKDTPWFKELLNSPYYMGQKQGVAEGKVKLYTDPDYFGAEVDDAGFDSLAIVDIPANQLVGFEPDAKMNLPKSKANVEKIVAGLKKGDKLPPLFVRKYKTGYQVLDGHHRFWAYKLSGIKSIPVQIIPDKDIEEISKQDVAEGSQEINWVKPNFDFEWHEVEEQSRMKQVPVDVRQYYQKHFPNKDAWLKAVQNGKAVAVPPDHAYEIRNAPFDKASLQKVLAPTGHEGPIGPAKEKRVNDLFDKGQVEMPIILKTSQGLWLIGGKTRLGTANYVKGLPAKVWLISGEQGVVEGIVPNTNNVMGEFLKSNNIKFDLRGERACTLGRMEFGFHGDHFFFFPNGRNGTFFSVYQVHKRHANRVGEINYNKEIENKLPPFTIPWFRQWAIEKMSDRIVYENIRQYVYNWAKTTVQKQDVAEGKGGSETSWSDDTDTITLQDILELTKHIKQINLPINDNLKSKLLHWEGNPEEIERVNQVTVSNQFPILIMVDEQGQIEWILDGNHRLHKAIQSQTKTIPAKLIKPSDLNDKAKKIFNIKEQGVAEDWNKVNHHDKTDGLSQKAVNAYRREHPGSKLKTAVTTKPSKLKAGSKDAKRRKSFCARMSGNKGPMKDKHGKPTPKAKALRRWNCESVEEMVDMIIENMDHAKDNQAVPELKAALLAKKSMLQTASEDDVYDVIDEIMTRIAKSHGMSGQKLHDMWVDKYDQIPDTWIMK